MIWLAYNLFLIGNKKVIQKVKNRIFIFIEDTFYISNLGYFVILKFLIILTIYQL